MPAENQEVVFPLLGLDVSGEFDRQRPGTTPEAVNVRGMDPILHRFRGGSRRGLSKYADQSPEGSTPIQAIGQLTICTDEALAAVFEDYTPDFIADPTPGAPNNREIPPTGSLVPLSGNWPPSARRRIKVTASPAAQVNGKNATITVTGLAMPGNVATKSYAVVLRTNPTGHDGEGDTGVTAGPSGSVSFTVNEPDYEGPIQYLAEHEYTIVGYQYPLTARGICQIDWGPDGDRALVVTSPDGSQLDADGKTHPLVGTLTSGIFNTPVPGIRLRLRTAPSGRVGDGQEQTTDSAGQVTFAVSDKTSETVTYTVRRPHPGTVSGSTSIQWGAEDQFATASQSGTTATATFTDSVGVGDTVVVAFFWGNGTNPAVVSVTDTLGTVYSHAGTLVDPGSPAAGNRVSVYYGRPTVAGSNAVTVTVSYSVPGTPVVRLACGDYRKRTTGAPTVATNFIGHPTTSTNYDDAIGTIGGIANQDHLYVTACYHLGPTSAFVTSFALSTGFEAHASVDPSSALTLGLGDNRNVGVDVPSPVEPHVAVTLSVATGGFSSFGIVLDFAPEV